MFFVLVAMTTNLFKINFNKLTKCSFINWYMKVIYNIKIENITKSCGLRKFDINQNVKRQAKMESVCQWEYCNPR